MSDLNARLEQIEATQKRISGLIGEIEGILETLVTNDTEILEALAQILLVVPQMQARNEQGQARVVEEIRKELRQFTLDLADRRSAGPAGGGPRLLETDPFLAANPEVGLLQHLYSFLPDPVALDIGAHAGEVAARLLAAGYEVCAFEPNPPTFEKLQKKFGSEARLHAFPCAVGPADATRNLHVPDETKGHARYGDPSMLGSLVEHPMPADLPFMRQLPVPVRSVESLRRAGEIPARAGVIKIDTEGFDLEVIRGLGADETPVVMTEFWDATYAFGRAGQGRLEDLAKAMRARGYGWYLVIYRQETGEGTPGEASVSYYANRPQTPPDSWGNAVFFRDHGLFLHAYQWCERALQETVVR